MRRNEFVGQIVEKTRLPREVMSGCCHMELSGFQELMIENYKGLLEYQPDRLVLLAGKRRIEIRGKNLELEYYAKEAMKVSGRIDMLIRGGE